MSKNEETSSERGRVGVIRAVNTYLRFYALFLILMEGILGVLCAKVLTGIGVMIGVVGMVGLLGSVLAVVTWFAVKCPWVLAGLSEPVNIDQAGERGTDAGEHASGTGTRQPQLNAIPHMGDSCP